jgi:hypothetical protein
MRIGALLLATGLLSVTNLPAQQPSASSQDQVSAGTHSVLDSTVPRPKGKGGLFGKAKRLANSKVVQTVTKTAACTMVPGGQALAGAIDAASSKRAGEAAQGVAGAASRSSCLPGMGAGMGAGMASAIAGAGAAMSTGAPMSAQMLSAQMGMAGTGNGVGSAGMDAGATGMMPDEKAMAACLGITLKEYHAFTNPTQGQSRPMTNDEMKRQAKIGKKIQGRQQACAMQQAASAGAP